MTERPSAEHHPPSILREVAGIWLASLALSGLCGLVALWVPFVAENLLAFVAGTFLYLPAWMLWRRGRDLTTYGLRLSPVLAGLLLFVATTAIVMPPFAAGYHYWQRLLFDRGPDLDHDHWVRFSRDLDDRPDLPATGETLHLWIEGQRLMALWSGDGTVDVTVEVTAREPTRVPIQALSGFRQDTDGVLRGATLAGARVDEGSIRWARTGPGGVGMSLRGIDRFRLATDATDVRLGRFAIAAEEPVDQERSAWWWLWMLGAQLILVAVPEEWFYRGYVQQRLDEAFGTRWKILGVELGWGWLLASVLFALGHLVLDARPERLAVFFPSLLFGYMKARTGSIAAPALFHALSNVWIQSLAYVYVA